MHTGSVGGGGGNDCPPHDNIFSLSGPQLRFMCLEALRRGSTYPQGTFYLVLQSYSIANSFAIVFASIFVREQSNYYSNT